MRPIAAAVGTRVLKEPTALTLVQMLEGAVGGDGTGKGEGGARCREDRHRWYDRRGGRGRVLRELYWERPRATWPDNKEPAHRGVIAVVTPARDVRGSALAERRERQRRMSTV